MKYCGTCFKKLRDERREYIQRVTYTLNGSLKTVHYYLFCKTHYRPKYKTFTDVTEVSTLINLTRLPNTEERITITTNELQENEMYKDKDILPRDNEIQITTETLEDNFIDMELLPDMEIQEFPLTDFDK
ncbi:hypothetical protein TSAR_011279 [Trichomalopsis sarcophagae]|uniref:Uncharacterized protein n=1 Tax=Trichomalopsis sarcophagae TaxID=543379 RepID=A0A232EJY5_9HYME|nr:hypothetical protein TSAR_011279 [Trichomalopsis sarcophagae]